MTNSPDADVLLPSGPPRANRAKRRLAAGGVATVIAGHSMTSDSIDFLGPLGFDAVWLEDQEALEHCEEIAAVEHLDVAFIAPNDLAQAMDVQGQPDHPDVVAAIEDGLARIAGVGGAVPGTFCQKDAAPRLIEAGARVLYTTYDAWLTESGRAWLTCVRAAEEP